MLTAEQQKTELIRAHSEAAAERVDDALSRLEAMQAEHERQAKVDADAAAGVVPAGFPYLARSVGRVMLRKAPPVRSGQVGVLDAGAEVTVEEAAETADGVARLRVVGSLCLYSGGTTLLGMTLRATNRVAHEQLEFSALSAYCLKFLAGRLLLDVSAGREAYAKVLSDV